ncbi:hypothetical protein MPH_12011 [Macrophomina phaseolina MS6]|uniref:Uncharacterized protein n=1 Tax=Macrophomina phaseolina (strain MS6) TaxID=1126212 RepID=K2R989_MACPH|nr:hypothetical protein MPH_12011 [Macrophomina phaseolina MS6]
MTRSSILFGGLGKANDSSEKDVEAPISDSNSRPQQRRRSSLKMQEFISSVRKLCDSVQQQARQTAAAAARTTHSRSGSRSDIARTKSTEKLVAISDEGCCYDSKSVRSVSSSRAPRHPRYRQACSGGLHVFPQVCWRRQDSAAADPSRNGKFRCSVMR